MGDETIEILLKNLTDAYPERCISRTSFIEGASRMQMHMNNDRYKEVGLREILQEFIDISFFDATDPARDKIIALKVEAKKLLGNQ